MLATCLSPVPVWAIDVANETQLRSAIFAANSGGDSTINVTANITLTQSLPMITSSVTVTGNGNTLDANNAGRAFFVQAGTAAVSNLTINNAVATGGAGGTANNVDGGGGGGGLGAGAAVFVNTGAAASLTNVTVGNASATGGAGGAGGAGASAGQGGGGGGGLGGAGGTPSGAGGGGGGGYAGAGGATSALGASGGGGGGGEFSTGGSTTGVGGGGGGGQQGNGGTAGNAGGGGGGATATGQNASGSTGGAGGVPQGGQGGNLTGGSPGGTTSAVAALGGGGGQGGNNNGSTGGAGLLSGGGGGGGVNGGTGGAGGVGGGGGGGSTNRSGGAGGDFGGGGGIGGSTGISTTAGQGGFGGGGGGASTAASANTFAGGQGGFGGGGGGGNAAGAAGTLAGAGGTGSGGGGGGGAALGGAFFVRDGGTLTLNNSTLAGTYGVTGGASGGGGATAGQAQGSTLYLQGGTSATVMTIASGTQTLSGADALAGAGGLTKSGAGTLAVTGANTNYTGATTVTGGLVNFAASNTLGSGTLTLNGGGLQWATGNTADISGRLAALGAGGGTFDTNGNNVTFASVVSGGGLTKAGAGILTLDAANTYSGATTINAGTLALGAGGDISASSGLTVGSGATFDASAVGFASVNGLAGGGTVQLGGHMTVFGGSNFSGVIAGGGQLEIASGTLTLSGTNTYTNATQIDGGATLALTGNGSVASSASVRIVGSGIFDISQTTAGATVNALFGIPLAVVSLGGRALTISGSGASFSGVIQDGGIGGGTGGTLAIAGGATQDLRGVNTYTGATTVAANSTLTLTNNGSIASSSGVNLTGTLATFDISGAASARTIQGLTGVAGSAVLLGNNNLVVGSTSSTTFAGVIDGSGGTGGLIKQGSGTLTLTGASTYSGPTTVTAGKLVVNGSLASTVTLGSAGTLGGSGTIGGLVSNGATLAPGNSIGTLNVNGNFSQTGGTYQVEANAAGQSDRINATGTATISGGAVQVIAAPGNYARSTTYTILNAAGGVSGTYSAVTSNFAFLTPSLSYDANNVFLTLLLQGNAFSGFGGNTLNQRNVGAALDQSYAGATGDFGTVIGALAALSTQQGPYALNQISGQPYADFGTANLAANTVFMNALGQQMALARGGPGSGQRQALAQACEVEACEGASPFSAWASGLGGFGSVQGDGNANTFTYTLAGAAAGIDYRVTPSLLLGLGVGYTNGTQWTDSFSGKGSTNAISVAAYGSFSLAGFYADLLAGYGYSNNQLQRQILVPGLQPRTANGSTGANQFLGQAEIGYQVPVDAPFAASVTPFARLQLMSVNQAGFSEWGANSLSLNVQQQTTNSVRSTLGAQLKAAIGLGDTRTVDLALRLGWLHEYADIGRPVTAAFAGAPANAFTVYGAAPQRDAAAIGFQATTNVAAATQVYFRYEGDIGSGTDNHALNVGVRLSW